jgi:hypothetical protein
MTLQTPMAATMGELYHGELEDESIVDRHVKCNP